MTKAEHSQTVSRISLVTRALESAKCVLASGIHVTVVSASFAFVNDAGTVMVVYLENVGFMFAFFYVGITYWLLFRYFKAA